MGNTSFAQAAYQILKQAGKPLTVGEITSIAFEREMVSTRGKTPSATMGARLYVDIKTRGDKSRFVKVKRGKFALREWSVPLVTRTPAFRPLTFKGAAYEVLVSENRPLRTEEITDIALKKGLLRTAGKTPSATMGAQLYTDIKTLGDKSTFVQLGKNKFGLREWGLEVLKDEIDKAEREKILPVSERKRSIVGDPISFEGLIYGPLNENGVIFLFSKIHNKLGINIEAIQAGFPDAKGRRKTKKGWVDVWIEFEFKSSHFKAHNHDPKECDIIVCWENDWKDCPITVIELKNEIQRLQKS
jgi:hypothetical protein